MYKLTYNCINLIIPQDWLINNPNILESNYSNLYFLWVYGHYHRVASTSWEFGLTGIISVAHIFKSSQNNRYWYALETSNRQEIMSIRPKRANSYLQIHSLLKHRNVQLWLFILNYVIKWFSFLDKFILLVSFLCKWILTKKNHVRLVPLYKNNYWYKCRISRGNWDSPTFSHKPLCSRSANLPLIPNFLEFSITYNW